MTAKQVIMNLFLCLSNDLVEVVPVYSHSFGNKAVAQWIKPIKKKHWTDASPRPYKQYEFKENVVT